MVHQQLLLIELDQNVNRFKISIHIIHVILLIELDQNVNGFAQNNTRQQGASFNRTRLECKFLIGDYSCISRYLLIELDQNVNIICYHFKYFQSDLLIELDQNVNGVGKSATVKHIFPFNRTRLECKCRIGGKLDDKRKNLLIELDQNVNVRIRKFY